METIDPRNYELRKIQIKWKWATRLVAISILGLIAFIMLGSLLYLIINLKTPPPDMQDLKDLMPYLIPFYSIFAAGIVGGLTWFAGKKHTDSDLKIVSNRMSEKIRQSQS